MELHEKNQALQLGVDRINAIQVLAKIVSSCEQDFITTVTFNTNRQTPIEPVNLRASDQIQLELRDKFRDDMKVFYEHQDNAFANLTNDDLTDMGIEQFKAIQIRRLAQTFLASQGEIDRMSRLNEVFENEKQYRGCSAPAYLNSPSPRIVLAYEIHFRLNRIAKGILDQGSQFYFIYRAKNLVWALLIQALLSSGNQLDRWLREFGQTLASTGGRSRGWKAPPGTGHSPSRETEVVSGENDTHAPLAQDLDEPVTAQQKERKRRLEKRPILRTPGRCELFEERLREAGRPERLPARR